MLSTEKVLLLMFLSLLVWDDASGAQDPLCIGNRSGIVQLFEWTWSDIEKECEYLGKMGYCAVQISPPNENKVVTSPSRPWWERYEPVSYKLETRSGSESDLITMVEQCRRQGVRVYAEVVLNHMARDGASDNVGTDGSHFDATIPSYSAVSYGPDDFHDDTDCNTPDGTVSDYTNATEVRFCRLNNMPDLRQESDYVRSKIISFLNNLLKKGVEGFAIHSAKYMRPEDLNTILTSIKKTKDGRVPFVYHEFTEEPGETIKACDYSANGRVTDSEYGPMLAGILRNQRNLTELYTLLRNVPGKDRVNYIDNHESQRDIRKKVLTHEEMKEYKLATAIMLADVSAIPRVMSSYYLQSTYGGPPHEADQSITSVETMGTSCKGEWVCEHRWRAIANMVGFRNVVKDAPIRNWWQRLGKQVAFSRGKKGFMAINHSNAKISHRIQTGLPGGLYCDIISGDLSDDTMSCTGKTIYVHGNGVAHIEVCHDCDSPLMALHIGAVQGQPARRY